MSNEEKANISINNDEASTSKIERIGSSQSFCSKSSTKIGRASCRERV